MKTLLKTLIVAFAIGLVIGSIGSSQAATRTNRKVVKTSKSSSLGDAMRPKKSLSFDGRSVEALKPGNYDSVSYLSEGNGNKGGHLYDLPKDFAVRTAEDQSELRYRK